MQDSEKAAAAFEATMTRHLRRRRGRAVEKLLPKDPRDRYALAFNRAMDGVHSDYVDAAYRKPLKVLAAMVTGGTLASFGGLMDMMARVVAVTALHYTGKSRRRWDRWVRVGAAPGDGKPAEFAPLVSSVGAGLDRRPARVEDPSHAAGYGDRLRLLVREARGLGALRLRVFREVRAAADRLGTAHGAFRAVAARAALDPAGRVTGVSRGRSDCLGGGGPSDAAVRRVRRLYREAEWYVGCRAFLLGYRPAPPL